jgi:hypothetical protein
MTSKAVNTCVVLVAQKGATTRTAEPLQTICSKIRDFADGFVPGLLEAGWQDQDIAVALFAQGVGLVANAARVTDSADRSALDAIAAVVRQTCPNFKVSGRQSL